MLESIFQSIPRKSGSYLLWMHLPRNLDLMVGKLGRFNFPSGGYAYLGSAHGSGGLRARLGRHLRGSDQLHWHIDYLRATAQVRGFGYKTSATHLSLECAWSQILASLPEARLPAPGFGASDCRSGCTAHLVHVPGGIQHIHQMIADQTSVHLRII